MFPHQRMPSCRKFFSNFKISSVRLLLKCYSTKLIYSSKMNILGIETSCDDTGCAVLNGSGIILGEELLSQNEIHLRYGGVNPVVAHELHKDNIEKTVLGAVTNAQLTFDNIDAIAVTTKPGIFTSLLVGVKYARHLAKKYTKPLISIHHMEAHALVTRMYNEIPVPFIVLLISGGHCLLAVANDVNNFDLLGQTIDHAPGEIMDKAARRMKLKNIPLYSKLAGGKAIEMAAEKSTNPIQFDFPLPLKRDRDCNFSFSGLNDFLVRKLIEKETQHGIMGDGIIPEVNNLCASYQLAITEHLMHRLERGIMFCEKEKLIKSKNIVVSGGVACNDFIFNSLQLIGSKYGYKVYRPPQKLCTDNGVMIAWNAIEKIRKGCIDRVDIDLKDIDPKAPFGRSLISKVKEANIQVRVTRLMKLKSLI